MNHSSLLQWIVLSAAIGSGLMAGVFFAFSSFVMAALARLPAAQGIAAMQSINLTVITPWFMIAFAGTAAASLVLLIASFFSPTVTCPDRLIAASLCYLVGTVLVTGMANVPRNNALAALSPESVESVRGWTDYLHSWTRWNHVRTLSSLAATVLFTLALPLSSKS